MSKIVEAGRQRRLTADFNKRHRKSQAVAGAVRMDLRRGITTFRDGLSLDSLMAALKAGGDLGVYKAIPWKRLEKELAPASDKLSKVGIIAAKSAFKELPAKPELAFDMRNKQFADFVAHKTGNLITVVQDGTLEAVRANTRRAFTNGLTPRDVADNIRGSIGLNARQAVALENYRNTLQQDGSLSETRRGEMAEAYEARLLDQRAVMIARTEVRLAQNAGEQEVWQAAKEQGLLPPEAKRIWVVDGNPCPKLCRPMNGVAVGIDEPWTLPDGRKVDNPSLSHPNCFCISSLDLTA